MKKKKIPKSLQGVLWSVDVSHLDIEQDKGYITHQIFAYGNLPEFLWLFKTYGIEKIRQVFTDIPYKDYRAARFHFIKNILLNLKDRSMDERYYVKNIPRAIG